jgi:small subunit ribosomal protein S16
MVKIRLQRGGAKKRPFYRIVAIDERRQRDGRALAFLGTYDPLGGDDVVKIQTDELDAWVAKGAQVSPTVRSLVKKSRARAAAAGAS